MYKGKQIAVFHFARRNEWYACQNLCPHKMQMILSRGMIGSEKGEPKVACPFHKKTFSLKTGKNLKASAPPRLSGLIEARGVGLLRLPAAKSAALVLAVKLAPRADIERLPEPSFFDCLGVKLPLLSLHAFDASTAAKIRLFLQAR